LEDNSKTDLKGIGLLGVELIHLAQDREMLWAVANMATNICFSLNT
jgi:hypothetical protein